MAGQETASGTNSDRAPPAAAAKVVGDSRAAPQVESNVGGVINEEETASAVRVRHLVMWLDELIGLTDDGIQEAVDDIKKSGHKRKYLEIFHQLSNCLAEHSDEDSEDQ